MNVAGAIPIAGNFNVNHPGDEIGLFNAGKWGLDFDADFVIEENEVFTGVITGVPVVGDFDGDGDDDLATFNNNQFFFDLATGIGNKNFFGNQDAYFIWGFPGVLDRPIAADVDQDGIDDIGLWVPRNSASLPREISEWYFLVSDTRTALITYDEKRGQSEPTNDEFFSTYLKGNTSIAPGQLIRFLSGENAGKVGVVTDFDPETGKVEFDAISPFALVAPEPGDIIAIGGLQGSIVTLNHAFSPAPFGNDLFAEFGDELALPLVGNFDPPTAPTVFAPDTGIAGDYDNSGGVGSGDYNAWKANFGSTTALANGNGDSTADAADYVMWRKFFSAAGGASAPSSAAGPDVDAAPADSIALAMESEVIAVQAKADSNESPDSSRPNGRTGLSVLQKSRLADNSFTRPSNTLRPFAANRSAPIKPAICDFLFADRRLILLDRTQTRTRSDFDFPSAPANDRPDREHFERDRALEIAWEQLA
jgi:hypothetical protein